MLPSPSATVRAMVPNLLMRATMQGLCFAALARRNGPNPPNRTLKQPLAGKICNPCLGTNLLPMSLAAHARTVGSGNCNQTTSTTIFPFARFSSIMMWASRSISKPKLGPSLSVSSPDST